MPNNGTIWWSNAAFFVGVHLAAAYGVYCCPMWSTPRATLVLTFLFSQIANFGITIGYHRLYSHKAFRAGFGVKLILSLCGSSACQGSIKWWALRHRLHHRYTDDPVHDPYAATRGLLWSHMGWIFFKSTYEKMDLIDKTDLDNDRIVKLQHRYYFPFVLFSAFLLPVAIGSLWHDAIGAFVWAGLVKCLITWHCTFMINSLAHWDGVQPYSDENTSRTNIIIALLTAGEGNHNFHSFPHDYRSGPSALEWDPSKWIILALHFVGLATGLRRARDKDLNEAKTHMLIKSGVVSCFDDEEGEDNDSQYPCWTIEEAQKYADSKAGGCIAVIDRYVVDATTYMGEHPGGATLLRKYSLPGSRKAEAAAAASASEKTESDMWKQATWAFGGGMNIHSRAAKRRMRELVVARLEA